MPLLVMFHTVYVLSTIPPVPSPSSPPPSVLVVSASDECPHLVDPFRQWTYYPKYVLQVIKMGMMVMSRGNLKERIPGKANPTQ
jgi:hypothetical protein